MFIGTGWLDAGIGDGVGKVGVCEGKVRVGVARRGGRCSMGGGGGGAVVDSSGEHRLHIVLVHPQIHWNTGNLGRTCLGLGATLHLVRPLGFSLDEKQIRRAGLDYWQHVNVEVHESWEAFVQGRLRQLGGTRLFFTKFGRECATEVEWPAQGNVVMMFGSEVNGFDGIRDWLRDEGRTERTVAMPMVHERFRSFNLSTTASMVSACLQLFFFLMSAVCCVAICG